MNNEMDSSKSSSPDSDSPAMPGDEVKMSAACWKGVDLVAVPQTWTRTWGSAAVEQIVDLAATINLERPELLASGLDWSTPPPGLRSQDELSLMVEGVRESLLNGFGFVTLSGFPLSDLGYRSTAKLFAVFSALVGSLRSQNAQGHLLGHVRDIGADGDDPASRIYQTNRRQTFHTDSTDAVGLMCINTALEGGQSMLVSVEAVYQEFKQRQPDLLAELFKPIATDRRGEVPEGQKPWFEIPVLSWFDHKLTGLYQRQYIESAKRFAEAPVGTERTRQALDLFDEIMNEPDMHLRMEFQPGDMQFVHNHSLLHDRTGFTDHVEPHRRRHLLRTWISLAGDRRLPPDFSQRYGNIEIGNRGGIRTPDTELTLPVDP